MKKFVTTLLVLGTGFGLAACESTSGADTSELAAPYADERTAGGEKEMPVMKKRTPVRSERVFRQVQTK